MVPLCSPAVHLTGWERLQAFRGLHDSARPGRTLPCCARQHAPCNFSAHNIISNFDTDARPLLDYRCSPSGLIPVAEWNMVYRSRTIQF
jgi:hypothetical protein